MAALLTLLLALPLSAQSPPAQATQMVSPASAAPTSPASSQEAYSLPPDKLAKAIAISHIRNILAIAGSIWGIVYPGLLLAMRGWTALER